MRAEQLLRDALTDLADQARTPDVALGRITVQVPMRPRRRRRTFALVLAAVVILALAVAVPTVLTSRTVEPVGRHRDPVTVNGRPGLWSGSSDLDVVSGVTWEYAPNAFALASCGGDSMARDVERAERVRFEPVPVRVPFGLRSLPRGYEARYLVPPLRNSEQNLLGGVQWLHQGEGDDPAFSLVVSEGRTEVPPYLPGWETDTIAGRPAVPSARDGKLCLNLDSGHTACFESGEGEPADLARSLWPEGRRELLVDLAERLVMAEDLDDPETWFPANRALPR